MRIKKETIATRRPFKEPTGRDYLAYYWIGIAGVLLLGALASVLDWSRFAFVMAGFSWGAIYVPIGVIVLRGRRENSQAIR